MKLQRQSTLHLAPANIYLSLAAAEIADRGLWLKDDHTDLAQHLLRKTSLIFVDFNLLLFFKS